MLKLNLCSKSQFVKMKKIKQIGFYRIKLIVPYGLIINAKIKTQCTLKNALELVGSPAVLCE